MTRRSQFLAKALPSTVEALPVIKASHLGWQDDDNLTQQPGYLAAVLTYDVTTRGEPNAYSIHLMRTVSADGRWLRIDSRRDLFWSQAESAFASYDKLAVRPGRI